MDFSLEQAHQVDALRIEGVADHIAYTPAAIEHVRKEVGDHQAIIGFAGSPGPWPRLWLRAVVRAITSARGHLFMKNPTYLTPCLKNNLCNHCLSTGANRRRRGCPSTF